MTPPPVPVADHIAVDELARFAVGCRLDDIPPEARDFGRILLLDTLGALLGGLRYPAVQALDGALGAGNGTAPFGRLLTWGTAATWLDADSGGSFHPAGARMPPVPTAHPAPHALPALLHAAAQTPVSDADLLRAFVIATEIGMRFGVGTSLRPGLHPHGIHGPIAAAVATSLVGGADAAATRAAMLGAASLPLAATLAVPMGGGTIRNVWTGLGAYYGTLAAAAASGTAPAVLSPPPGGLGRLYSEIVCTDPDLQLIGGELGARWEIRNSYLKPFACARWIHPALEALRLALGEAGNPAADDIDAIEVDTFAFAASLNSRGTESDMHARFSLPRCLATVAVDGRLDADGFLPDRFHRPQLDTLIDRITIREDREFTAALPHERPTRVTVTANGRSGVGLVRNASGNPDAPLTIEQVVTKFGNNAGDIVPAADLDAVIAALVPASATGRTPRTGAAGVRISSGSADDDLGGNTLARLAHSLMGASA